MPTDSDIGRLQDMLRYARKALRLVHECKCADRASDELLSLGLERCLEIIGEAASHVTTETRDLCIRIQWKRIVGMRHILIHGYTDIDQEVVSRTVTQELPLLIGALEGFLGPEADADEASGDD